MRTRSALLALSFTTAAVGQWSPTNSGITDLSQGAYVLGATPTHLFAKAGSTLYRSSDNGDTWTAATAPIAGNPTECGFWHNGRYFAGLNAATDCIYWTDDNGDTWNTVTGAPTATVVRGFLEYGGGLFAYTSNAGILGSIDGGDTWQSYNNGLTALNVIGMSSSGPYVMACTIGGGVFRSPGGSSWTASTGIAGGDLNGEHIWRMGSTVYYAAQGGAEYQSTDFGATWSSWTQPSFFGLGLLEVKRFGNNLYMETRHFAGALRDSLYLSVDEGASWTNITGNLNAADLNGGGIVENNGCVFIGYNLISPGQGIYRRCGATGVEEGQVASMRVFPNPGEGLITVVLPQQAIGSDYRLVDITGVEVLRGRISGMLVDLDLTALAAGTYLLHVESGSVAPVRVVKQ